jgi:hypothetical protein
MGKILAEAEGEVQEFIDICDLAQGNSLPFVYPLFLFFFCAYFERYAQFSPFISYSGMSRTINGLVLPSERANHVIMV